MIKLVVFANMHKLDFYKISVIYLALLGVILIKF